MIESKKRWRMEQSDDQIVQHLQQALKLPPVSAKLLASRGFIDVDKTKAFLNMNETSMHDPYMLHDMDKAVTRIKQAIANEELILVYGDYDADGVTSTSVMMTALQLLDAQVTYVIPNRFVDGYGPSERLFKEAYEDGVNLIITVDNGISGVNEIQLAKELGMDVIVTDHHEAGEILPPADMIIHPRHPLGNYPFGELAGVGIAFKVAHALLGEVPKELFELVAIGTVADLVSLHDENRYFVQQGIKQMRESKRPAIQALCQVAGTEQNLIDEETIGFLFGPRINALGRLADAGPGVELFLSTDSVEAMSLAKLLDTHNKERQGIVSKMTEEAIAMVEAGETGLDPHVIIVAKEDWNPGVVGIVASRLVEKYYRPTIVLGLDSKKGVAKGSGRSIAGFNLYNELAKNRDILPQFGGHPMAAGMTLSIEHVEELRNRLQNQAEETLSEEDLQPVQKVDISININEIDLKSIESLKQLGPFGMGFPKPMYCIERVNITSMRKIGANQNHVKMELADGPHTLDAVGFSQGNLADELTPGIEVSFIGDIQINEWNGRKKPQFMIEDAKTDEWQLYDIRGIRQVNRWNQIIQPEQTLYLAFNQKTIQHFESLLNVSITLVSGNQPSPEPKPYIVLLDIPHDEEILETILTHIQPKRIYAHFYAPDSTYFEVMPSRDHFKWYYGFLVKRPSFDLQQHVNKLAKHKGWTTSTLFFMTEVFFDLGFVKMNNGRIDMQETAVKRDLAESMIYQSREQQMQLEQKLLYAPYMELRQWFDKRLAEQTVPEEEQQWI
ncbi:single-stranded-DNA-specific exonuclease RecJ [Paenisporosarcina antarctica]|uniref:Single-stranded-DNA-specific exonuclease RecJ n=1 Tax=Paenisporosarcina antarctica TaxID=417367 RepID=A0A4P6ZX22_9BACL|nr:single-stranded-DNA-specific exonuclease RecJ [Paenisporosarcina antarctica]QBP40804.1 single-stranded-DNA-specific exonuclease RecJ [Paenisporosarcina antarctica]